MPDINVSDIRMEDLNLRIFLSTRLYLVLSVVMLLASLGILFFAIIPQARETYSLYTEVQNEKPELEQLEDKLAQLEGITTTPEYAQIETVNSALPSHKPLLELLTAFNQVSTQTQVTIEEFELSPGLIASEGAELESSSSGPYDQLTLTLSLSGTFEQVQEFMVQVEQFSPFTEMTELEVMGSQTAPDGTEVVRAELTTETYYFTQPVRVTVEQPLPALSNRERQVLDDLAELEVIDLPTQTQIEGGGLEDLFGVESLFLNQELQQELDQALN